MTNHESSERAEANPQSSRLGRRRWQFGLRTTIWLVAISALVMSIIADRRRIAILAPKVQALRPIARELEIIDPSQTAAVLMPDLWQDEDRWEVYLPKGRRYRLCIATRGVEDGKTTTPSQSTPIASGRQIITLKERREIKPREWIVTTGLSKLTIREDAQTIAYTSWGGGSNLTTSQQAHFNNPIILFLQVYLDHKGPIPVVPAGPSDGVLLWIEPDLSSLK